MAKRKAISKADRLAVYNMYDGHCAYCGCMIEYKDMQVDHVVSIYAHNGVNVMDNYMPACRMCNFYKSTYPLDVFREQLGKLPERLEKQFIYRLAKKYGLVEEQPQKIKFYFEIMEEQHGKSI